MAPHPTLGYAIRPGGLSAADRAQIETLAYRGWGATRISRTLGKHPSTVRWFLLRAGLIAPKPSRRPAAILRQGRVVYGFSAEEDAFIEALRLQGLSHGAIAARATERFGHTRNPNTVLYRLTMLGARGEARHG